MPWAKECTKHPSSLLQGVFLATALRTCCYYQRTVAISLIKNPKKIGRFGFKSCGNFGLKRLTVTKSLKNIPILEGVLSILKSYKTTCTFPA